MSGVLRRRVTIKNNTESYTLCSYLTSANDVWIDSGVNANSTIGIEQSIVIPNTGNITYINAEPYIKLYSTTDYAIKYEYNSNTVSYGATYQGTRVMKIDANNLYWKGSLVATAPAATFDTTTPILVCGYNYLASTYQMKFYYCKIWNNGTLVRNFVPAYDSKNVGCFYDNISNKLYYSKSGNDYGYVV